MKMYTTEYTNKVGKEVSNSFIILSDKERLNFGDRVHKLLAVLDHYKKTRTLSEIKWKAKDDEAIQLIQRICFTSIFKDAEILDPSRTQLVILNKMLKKLVKMDFYTFAQAEPTGFLSSYQMKKHMDRKRWIQKELHMEYYY